MTNFVQLPVDQLNQQTSSKKELHSPPPQLWKTDRFLVPFRPGALFSIASYPVPPQPLIPGANGRRAP